MQRMMGVFFAVALAIGTAVIANAQTVGSGAVLEWDHPTERMDGTPLAVEEIAAYRVYYVIGDDAASISTSGATVDLPVGTTATLELPLPPRAEPYVVHFAIAARAKNSGWGPLSAVVSRAFLVQSISPPVSPATLRLRFTCDGSCVVTPVE